MYRTRNDRPIILFVRTPVQTFFGQAHDFTMLARGVDLEDNATFTIHVVVVSHLVAACRGRSGCRWRNDRLRAERTDRRPPEKPFGGLDQFAEFRFGVGIGVDPVRLIQDQAHGTLQRRLVDPVGNDNFLLGEGQIQLTLHPLRERRRFREDQHEKPAGDDRLVDHVAVIGSGRNVARRHPAPDSMLLQDMTDRQRRRFVAARIADKDIVIHRGRLQECSESQN